MNMYRTLHRFPSPARSALCAVLAALGLGNPAVAEEGSRALRVPPLPRYQQECAACHVAYPPGLLHSASWQRVLADLPRHYGVDASLDPAVVKELATWLSANAATGKGVGFEPPQDRITRSPWFIRKHREVAAAVWQRPAVRSAANCTACHAQAEQGDFNEHNVRIPR